MLLLILILRFVQRMPMRWMSHTDQPNPLPGFSGDPHRKPVGLVWTTLAIRD